MFLFVSSLLLTLKYGPFILYEYVIQPLIVKPRIDDIEVSIVDPYWFCRNDKKLYDGVKVLLTFYGRNVDSIDVNVKTSGWRFRTVREEAFCKEFKCYMFKDFIRIGKKVTLQRPYMFTETRSVEDIKRLNDDVARYDMLYNTVFLWYDDNLPDGEHEIEVEFTPRVGFIKGDTVKKTIKFCRGCKK